MIKVKKPVSEMEQAFLYFYILLYFAQLAPLKAWGHKLRIYILSIAQYLWVHND